MIRRTCFSVPGLAALCVLLLVAGRIPDRVVPGPPMQPRADAAIAAPQVSEDDSSLQIDLDMDGDYDTSLLQQWVNQIDGQSARLSDAIRTDFDAYRLGVPLNEIPDPWVDFDGSVTVTDTGLRLTIPKNEVSTQITWWLRMIAQAVGILSALAVRISCYAFFSVGAALAGPVCAALGGFTGTMIYQAFVIFVDGKQTDPGEWAKALAAATAVALGATAWEKGLNKFAKEQMRPLYEKFSTWVGNMATTMKSWAGQTALNALDSIKNNLQRFADLVGAAFEDAFNAITRPTDWPADSVKVMVVGDSLSQGAEGDYTWRYRLWQWFAANDVTVDFVGPYSGTKPPQAPSPPTPPPLLGSDSAGTAQNPPPPDSPEGSSGGDASGASGQYAAGVGTFDSDHFAAWGRQIAQDKTLIRQEVATYQPDLVLVALGFNDMGWFASDADGTLDSMKTLVDEARAAKPGIDFALADVPQRSDIGRPDLVTNTTRYDGLLADAVPTWSTAASRVELVDWSTTYQCGTDSCPAGYDGLHPNALGEYQLAHAFEETLHDSYGLGASVPAVPAQVPTRPTPVPSNVTAESSPLGVTVTWDPVFGALGYTIRVRAGGAADWNEVQLAANRYDTTWTTDGQQWEYQVRTWNGDARTSDWSATVSATAHPQTAPPPGDIATHGTPTGVDVTWTAPTGPYTDTIDRYGLLVFDDDTAGAYVMTFGVRGTSAHVDDLTPGHHYEIAMNTWNAAGGGIPSGGPSVLVG